LFNNFFLYIFQYQFFGLKLNLTFLQFLHILTFLLLFHKLLAAILKLVFLRFWLYRHSFLKFVRYFIYLIVFMKWTLSTLSWSRLLIGFISGICASEFYLWEVKYPGFSFVLLIHVICLIKHFCELLLYLSLLLVSKKSIFIMLLSILRVGFYRRHTETLKRQ
jgi:hypothetical protein